MSFLCLVSVFKNESHILEEWIQHYIKQGVDHFFLTDNGSTDNYMQILDKYISTGIVSLNINPERYKQSKHMNHYLDKIKNYEWTIVCDLDEFIYARRDFSKISDYLRNLNENVNQIHIPWKLFGSNGHITQPDKVVPNFLKRQNYPDTFQINCKCINRTKNIKTIDLHCCFLIDCSGLFTSDGNSIGYSRRDFALISESILESSQLHLNHYAIQSWEWFKSVKMTRGDATSSSGDNIRNEGYFREYDHACIFDDELKNINST
jgi:glycosyltransferase involved in cell wall biosynthesis